MAYKTCVFLLVTLTVKNFLTRKIYSYLPPVKDALGLRMLGVNSILYECDQVYIGQSGRIIQIRIKEHSRHIWLA